MRKPSTSPHCTKSPHPPVHALPNFHEMSGMSKSIASEDWLPPARYSSAVVARVLTSGSLSPTSWRNGSSKRRCSSWRARSPTPSPSRPHRNSSVQSPGRARLTLRAHRTWLVGPHQVDDDPARRDPEAGHRVGLAKPPPPTPTPPASVRDNYECTGRGGQAYQLLLHTPQQRRVRHETALVKLGAACNVGKHIEGLATQPNPSMDRGQHWPTARVRQGPKPTS